MAAVHIFAGYPSPVGPCAVAHITLNDGVWSCKPLAHYVKHSPDGFGWGYGGSGPGELARCLLIAALGDASICGVCAGRSHPDHASCPACNGTGIDHGFVETRYMRVKDVLVAPAPQNEILVLTGDQVLAAAGLTTEGLARR